MTPTNDLDVDYSGRAGRLLALSIKTLALTLLTLGIYRFWMKTRLRRYYWSAIRPGGVPLEYTGTGLEKLLGFLIAVLFLAVYLGLFNLALSFAGLAFFQGHPLALNLSLLAVVPLYFYASFRARAYLLSRTRWRGIRFGMDKGAVAYAAAALGHSVLTVVTLGLMYPRMHFKLEKFVTDRTWFGTLKLKQGGGWGPLFRPWIGVLVGIVLLFGTSVVAAAVADPAAAVLVLAALVVLVIAFVVYSVAAFRTLTAAKSAGIGVGFHSRARATTVLRVYILGGLGLTAVLALAVLALGAAAVALLATLGIDPGRFIALAQAQSLDPYANLMVLAFMVFSYFAIMLLGTAFSQVLILQPILRHYASTITLSGTAEIVSAGQREFDEAVEAGGFADALDVGAAI